MFVEQHVEQARDVDRGRRLGGGGGGGVVCGGGGGGGVIVSWGVSLYRLGISESMRSFTGLPFLEIATFIIWITSCFARFAFVVFRRYTLIVCFSTVCMLLLLGLPVWKREIRNVHNDVSACCAHEVEPELTSLYKCSLRERERERERGSSTGI